MVKEYCGLSSAPAGTLAKENVPQNAALHCKDVRQVRRTQPGAIPNLLVRFSVR